MDVSARCARQKLGEYMQTSLINNIKQQTGYESLNQARVAISKQTRTCIDKNDWYRFINMKTTKRKLLLTIASFLNMTEGEVVETWAKPMGEQ